MASGVLPSCPHTCTDHGADDERATSFTTEHIAQLGPLIEDHVPAHAKEIYKHQFSNRTETGGSSTHGCANITGLGNWSIEHTLASKFLHQPFGDTEDATTGIIILKGCHTCTTGYILSHQNNSWITAHLQAHSFVDGLGIGKFTNCDCHCLLLCARLGMTSALPDYG